MIIDKIEIYGYGKWVNQTFDINNQIQLFVGRNESGKSTLQSFIRSILFGFPDRRRKVNKTNRYQPKNQDVYGGRLRLSKTTYGDIWIERTQDDGLVITTVDGDVLDASVLDEMLGGIDVALYDSFYAFTLSNLQQLANIGSDQLNDYFLGIGTLGSDHFIEMAKAFDKQQKDLYKPAGKKPELNQLLEEYQLLANRSKKLEVQLDRYNYVKSELQKINQQINATHQKITDDQEKLNGLQKLMNHYDLNLKLKSAEAELQTLDYTEILDTLPQSIAQAEAMIQRLSNENISLEAQIQQIEEQIQRETRINWAENRIEQRQQWVNLTNKAKEHQKAAESLARQIKESDQSLEQIAIRSQFNPDQIENSEEYEQRVERGHELIEEIETIQQHISRNKNERAMLLEQRRQFQNRNAQTRQQMAVLENQQINLKEQLLQETKLSHYFISFGMIIASIVGWLLKNMQLIPDTTMTTVMMGILCIGGLIGTGYVYMNHRRKREVYERQDIEQKIESLADSLAHIDTETKEISININQREEKLSLLSQQLNNYDGKRTEWLLSIGFYPSADSEIILKTQPYKQYFAELEKNQLLIAEYESFQEQLQIWQDQLAEFMNRFNIVNDNLRDQIGRVEMTEQALQQLLNETQLKREQQKNSRTKLVRNQEEIDKYQQFIDETYHKYNVNNRMEFDRLLVVNKRYNELVERIAIYNEQLADFDGSFEHIENKQALANDINHLERELERHKKLIQPLSAERANFEVEINNLEHDGTYPELIQEMADKQAEIKDKFEEWAKYRLAIDIIYNTLRRGLDNPVGEMNQIANHIFEKLSNQRYKAIKMNKNDIYVVMNDFDSTYRPHELSQGTLEQLYVALRIAFILSAQSMIKMPIIIDDAFVNFDDRRKENMYEILQSVSEKNQILFFTFDHSAEEYFDEADIINLEVL